MTEIGFVGLGRMGYEMARHLVGAGFEVLGVDVSDAARVRASSAGIRTTADAGELAGVEVVLSSLPDTPQALEVYTGERGLFGAIGARALCIDLSTISVDASRSIAERGSAVGIDFLDAPVSGTSIHAAAGSLAIMVGGPAGAVDRARPYLAPFSTNVHHCGPNGSGLEMKLITNRLLTAHLVAIAEAIIEMEDAGLDVSASLELLRAGAVPRLLEYKAGPMAARDYSPLFTVDLMSKDLGLADERRPPGPVTERAVDVMRRARSAGWGPEDIAAVMEIVGGGETSARPA